MTAGGLLGTVVAIATLFGVGRVLYDGWSWQREHDAELRHQRAMDALRDTEVARRGR